MPVAIRETLDDRYLEVTLSGKLDKNDYKEFVPLLERAIEQHEKVRLVVVLRDFHGWTAGALWEDIKFDWKHFRDFERIAIVGEKRWHEGMAAFCKPFTTAKIQYFERSELDDARHWITTDVEARAAAR